MPVNSYSPSGPSGEGKVFILTFGWTKRIKRLNHYIGKRTIVFDDIRFPNEGWAIRRWGHAHEVLSEIVHISRKGHEPDENETHVSEAGLPKGMIDKWVSVEDGKA